MRVGTCKVDALCTGINCTSEISDTITNLTFFPCNGTVSIHLVILQSGNMIAANVTTSEYYSGPLLNTSKLKCLGPVFAV